MTTLALIRHAPTPWNAEKRLQGRTDVGLDDRGRALVGTWRLPEGTAAFRWWSSPLKRATETAALLGLEFAVEPLLAEMSWGQWEGLRLADIEGREGPGFRLNERRGLGFRAPGGESPRDVQARLSPWLVRIGGKAEATGAVTHNGVIRALFALAAGWDMTGRPPVKLRDRSAHFFTVDDRGQIAVERLNVGLETTACAPR